MAVKKAPVKKPGTAVVLWDEELAELAALESKAAKPTGGSYISIAGGSMTFKGEEIPGDSFDGVVLGFVYENTFYEGKWDKDNPTSPVCYAFGTEEEGMSPREACEKPQNDICATCDQNKYGSADTGKGKACKNQVKIAVIPFGDAEEMENAEVAFMRIPPTSKKAWDDYFNKYCAKHPGGPKPACFFITKITAYKKEKTDTYCHVKFDMEGNFKDMAGGGELWGIVKAKRAALGNDLIVDYAPPSEEPVKPVKKTSAKFRKK